MGTDSADKYEVDGIPGEVTSQDSPEPKLVEISNTPSFKAREDRAMATFEREMSAAQTPEDEEMARRNRALASAFSASRSAPLAAG